MDLVYKISRDEWAVAAYIRRVKYSVLPVFFFGDFTDEYHSL